MATQTIAGCACPTARHEHGTNRNYAVHRCRCFACRVAHANAQRAYRSAKSWREMRVMPAVGVRRRLQALAAIGYNARDLAAHLDISAEYVAKLRTDQRHPLIRRETHDAVCRVYDLLWDKRRIDANARRTMTLAGRVGYLPPLAWDDETIDDPAAAPTSGEVDEQLDEVAVERIMAGSLHVPSHSQSPERREAILRLAARGHSDSEIADRLGMTTGAVCYTRLRHDIPAGVICSRAAS